MSGWHNGYHILKALYGTIIVPYKALRIWQLAGKNYFSLQVVFHKLLVNIIVRQVAWYVIKNRIRLNFCNNDSCCFAIAVSLTLVQLISLYFCSSDPKPMRIIAHQQQNRPLYRERSHTYTHHEPYSCMLSCLAFEWKWGWRWPCFDRNLTAFHM